MCFLCFKINHIAYQCPNKRVMILYNHGDIVSKIYSNDEKMPPLEDTGDRDVEYLF